MNNQNIDLNKILSSENVNIWSANQEELEEQALRELEVLRKDNENSTTDQLEDGEIEASETGNEDYNNANSSVFSVLNIEQYIQRQEDLKKRQDFKKALDAHPTTGTIHSNFKKSSIVIKKHKRKLSPEKSNQSENESQYQQDTSQINTLYSRRCTNSTSDVIGETKCIRANSGSEDASEDENNSGSEYIPSENEKDSDYESFVPHKIAEPDNPPKKKRKTSLGEHKIQDDGKWKNYKKRLDEYYKKVEENVSSIDDNDEDHEEKQVTAEFHSIKGGLRVPINIWTKLYGYQQDSIHWLWQLHQKATGGLLGDEMGLGKTVQIIVFLHALEFSRVISCHGRFNGLGPSLIVCPATVIQQWVKHFHEWAPEFRVAILHQSGSYQGNKALLIKDMHKSKGILITTYSGVLTYNDVLVDYNWHYLILDEGHKIRNPAAKATVAVKRIRTPHRIMLTGSPMQNNLTELWSLFDFTNPGVLGDSATFQEHFANPILHGGFANSTPSQEATALSVATMLKSIIDPYLLRRTKSEVQHHISLPNKSEQVLFCSLTKYQIDLYKNFLMSEQVSTMLGRGIKHWYAEKSLRAGVLVAITKLRKICNHPDIFMSEEDSNSLEDDDSLPLEEKFGYYKKSGKMVVVSALLKIWKKQGHRVLLFTQGRAMIVVFQQFLDQHGYKYLKMDGSTSIRSRQSLIDKFNQDSSFDVFLLTTRVGGLGVNLTGANRVIIYDPDWNPATDTQARERAWRIGQEKNVTVYRLLSAGTIEEKMYQRQVWKQLLSNKILLDPKTNKFFRSSDLHDLFSLQESTDSNPETANIFHNSRVRIQESMKKKKELKSKKLKKSDVQFTEDKLQQMKNLAHQIAKSLTKPKSILPPELEEEKLQKLKEKEEIKTLSPQALLDYNREKAKQKETASINKIDNCEATVSFSEALEYSEKTAKLHHVLNSSKADHCTVIQKAQIIHQKITKEPEQLIEKYKKSKPKNVGKEKRKKDKAIVDTSGKIDGEIVDGLVKTEIKRQKKSKKEENVETHDDYVLGKLFQKKGVSRALQHESIVQSGSRGGNLRIHFDARQRAEKSLEALRKSRIDNWRW
ncbi:unnamed protein product [Phaedon cochleariae]|uniref:DNA repair and recombination protein RAD54-like n=1 Tax=Phaedon cochleariae TaxID=80249 RepID=A0A9P0GNN7_PHACE|nr:unnamed protein product [Phaedon cochleariae]